MTRDTVQGQRLADLLEQLRQTDRKKLAIRALAAIAALGIVIWLGTSSCSSGAYGSFSRSSEAFQAASGASGSAVGASGSGQIAPTTNFDGSDSSSLTDVAATSEIVVFVSGAVQNPGLYQLTSGSRIGDAIALAGGIREDGAPDAVNLAAPLEDGQQIRIPTREEADQAAAAGISLGTDGTGAGAGAAAGSGTASAGSSGSGAGQGSAGGQSGRGPDGKVNINTADSSTLQTLTGIGPATAQKIIDYRTAHGPFARIEDLKVVSGIGQKKYEAIADAICV